MITRCYAKVLGENQSYVHSDTYVPPTTHQNTHTSLNTNHPHHARLADAARFRGGAVSKPNVVFIFFKQRVVKTALEKTVLGWGTV